ncbi:glycosyl hydrolase (plasmid) [Alteromonas sp. I4]|nr:glycosyl hydrolase [Alteromonas sp. I4]
MKFTTVCVSLAMALFSFGSLAADQVGERVETVLAQLSLEEKIDLLHGAMTRYIPEAYRPEGIAVGAGYVKGIPRLNVPHLVETDASMGVSNLGELRPGDQATALPAALSLAASWDPTLAYDGGKMIGKEAKRKGFNVMLVGGVNLIRDPRAGRNFEYLGEDPLLAGTLVGHQIKGVQANNIIATIKHLALNDLETGRSVHSVNMGDADMRESDLLAFELGIEIGAPGSVMCAYNRVNGIFTCENPYLLTEVLRDDWGYDGFVMSDWGSVKSTEAILAGLDQQSGEQIDRVPHFSKNLLSAVQQGKISEEYVDRSARRVLRSIFRAGLDTTTHRDTQIDFTRHKQFSLKAAEQGIVLLKNINHSLPLSSETNKIVVVGQHADIGVLSGGGSSQVTPIGGFKKTAPGSEKMPAASFALKAWGGTSPFEGIKQNFENSTVVFVEGKNKSELKAAIQEADAVIVFAEHYATEAEDKTSLTLDDNQDELIELTASYGKKTIVVLQLGNPVVMPWLDKVDSVLISWFSGQAGGQAIANVLSGQVNPGGHLPVTFPASVDQLPLPVLPGTNLPPATDKVKAEYGLMADTPPFDIVFPEGSDVGYRWFDKMGHRPLFPFGYGLSYTEFTYSNAKIDTRSGLSISFTITNSGELAGKDVPQVYIKRKGMAKRLIGWATPFLQPGESKEIELLADARIIGDWDEQEQRWFVPGTEVTIEIGDSSTNPILVKKVTIPMTSMKYR